jgi:hypothetical protein
MEKEKAVTILESILQLAISSYGPEGRFVPFFPIDVFEECNW